MKIELIVAMDLSGLIGFGNELPWNEPNDLARFVAITKGHAVMMGYNTWLSLPHRPLTGRMNIVLTTRQFSGRATAVNCPYEGITAAKNRGYRKLFIIGGAKLYTWALNNLEIDEIHLTQFQKVVSIKQNQTAVRFPVELLTAYKPVEAYYRLTKNA